MDVIASSLVIWFWFMSDFHAYPMQQWVNHWSIWVFWQWFGVVDWSWEWWVIGFPKFCSELLIPWDWFYFFCVSLISVRDYSFGLNPFGADQMVLSSYCDLLDVACIWLNWFILGFACTGLMSYHLAVCLL